MNPTGNNPTGNNQSVADAQANNWVDRLAPAIARPYLRLARADRPIGVWLLLWPCWWSLALADLANGKSFPNIWYLVLFAIGAVAMRGAGCAYNDIVDREIDVQVTRTKSRPIPSGQISVLQALIFMLCLCLIGLAVLLQFNTFTILLGFMSLIFVAVYPFMKRISSYPQLVLGLAFSWGALMGWAATNAKLDWPAIWLYVSAICWTVGYDTIYAHQDKEDDAIIGLGSTALAFGNQTQAWLAILYALTILAILTAGVLANAGSLFLIGIMLATFQLCWQVSTLDIENPDNCLKRFRSNRDFGAIVFFSLLADMYVSNF